MDYGWIHGAGRGSEWVGGDLSRTRYNHALTPQQPSCFNGSFVPDGIYTAASEHAGGVNLLMADGRVTFVSVSIDSGVWRALGSIAGRESFGDAF